jgi:hypothetical protein
MGADGSRSMSDLLTVAEVAKILKVSEDTVLRRFEKVKGVVDLGSAETPRKRRYRVLRIPKIIVEKFVLARGGHVHIEMPPPIQQKPSREVAPRSEADIISDLATVANQKGDAAQKTLERIERRARAMTFVPESQWEDMVWFDEEE